MQIVKQNDSTAFILERKSVRNFQQVSLGEDQLSNFQSIAVATQHLEKNNSYNIKFFDFSLHYHNSKALGAYGRIMMPPHYFVTYMVGNTNMVVDLGFRTQHVVLGMWREGIGSCYIGCVHRQEKVKRLLNLPPEAVVVSLVAFGLPEINQPEKLFRKISQLFVKSDKRHPLNEIFLDDSWKINEIKEEMLNRVIEAARYAPSAVNAQPWRFMIRDDKFIIFAKTKQPGKMYDLNNYYPLHDAGICMANMSVAARELGANLNWQWINHQYGWTNDESVLPISFFPLADLRRK